MVVEHVIKEWLTLKQRMLNLLTDSIYRVWNPLILAIFTSSLTTLWMRLWAHPRAPEADAKHNFGTVQRS